MHYHCEIILPPTDDIAAAIESVLKPFNEQPDKSDEDCDTSNSFWDWFVVGGRYAGTKLTASLDPVQLEAFNQWCRDEKITVSGLQCGKQELEPRSQIPKVDAKWREMFPGIGEQCPIFQHSNDQYGRTGSGTIAGDICNLTAVPVGMQMSRIIFAGPSYQSETSKHDGPLQATFMLAEDAWNGVNHMPVTWDCTVADALKQFRKRLENYKDTYAAIIAPQDNWLAVTVDYHS